MTWIKINDSFPDHPKIIGLSDKAFRIHISGLCYCGTYLTDGLVPMAVASRLADNNIVWLSELTSAGLWIEKLSENGFVIHDYLLHQSSKRQVEDKKELSKARVERFRQKKETATGNAISNALVTRPEYREQNTENREQKNNKKADLETLLDLPIAKRQETLPQAIGDGSKETSLSGQYIPTLPRSQTAKTAILAIRERLASARDTGINAWNLSLLIEEAWDDLHAKDDMTACYGLTVWYVTELLSRDLTSTEIARITQLTKRYGRIALLAIDIAAGKDLTKNNTEGDLVSYATKVASSMYKERKANNG